MRIVVTLLVLCAGTARADDMRPEARQKFQDGIAAFQAKRYAEAAVALRAAHEADPQPDIMFAWAQAERLAGNCEGAVPLYRKLLSTAKGVQRGAVEELLEKCELELARRAPPAPPAIAEATPPPPVDSRPFYTDVLGDVLVGSGVLAVGVGTTLLVLSGSARDDARRATTYDEFASGIATADSRRIAGSVVLAAGVGLATAGVLRWLLHDSGEAPKLSVTMGDGVAFIGVSGDL